MLTTCFMNVHGKNNPSADEPKEQCTYYTSSLQTALVNQEDSTYIIFLGDFNARWGGVNNGLEEKLICKYDESNTKRNLGGMLEIEFFLECNVPCLNGEKSKHIHYSTQFTAEMVTTR